MTNRHRLKDEQWQAIKDVLLGKEGDKGSHIKMLMPKNY